MYIVKYGDQYIHDPFSDLERASDIRISADVNASGTCTFTIAPSHPIYNKLKLRDASNNVTVLQDDTVLFDGYIYSFDTNFDKTRDVTCYGCLSYLGDIRLRPYATEQSDDDPPGMLYCSKTIDGLFEFYIDQYNTYADEGRKFQIGVNEGSVIRETNSISASSDSYPTVADELTDKLLNEVGGYIFIRHSGRSRVIDYFANCTDVNAQIVDFGVNILDFLKTDTMSGFYTALRPSGGAPEKEVGSDDSAKSSGEKGHSISLNDIGDGLTDVTGIAKKGDVVYNESAVSKYGYIEKYQNYSEITDVASLMHQAAVDLKIASEVHPTIEVKAIDLALYQKGNKPLVPGQLVRIRSIPHDIDKYMMLNSMDIDISDPSQTVYTFGEAIDSLTGEQNKKAAELNASINHSLDAVAELDQTTKDQAIAIGNAQQAADDAQQSADNAQNAADNAQNAADNAQQAADNAQQAADNAQEAIDAAQEIINQVQGDVDNIKSDVETVKNDSAAVSNKVDEFSKDLDATKATVEQTVTEFGEVKTSVSNAVTKADQSLQVSTEAYQSATEAKTTAESAYTDAQTSLTQSSQAVQTANEVKVNLSTNYQTKGEADAKYATQSSLTATSEQIKTEVSQTYATKDTVNALENIANNAVQTWVGPGAPTLENQPASDWNTNDLKKQHSGDIYYDTETGYAYRFGSTDGSTYSWSLIKDTDIAKAVADAAEAQEIANGAQSTVTELKNDIPAIYATKTELTQTADSIQTSVTEIGKTATNALTKATTVEQTAESLTVKVTAAVSTANSASTTATNASERVAEVATCIKMTTQGVRVGRISNGNFTGYSALVNSNGSFDILDSNSDTTAKFTSNGLSFYNPANNRESVRINASTNGGTNTIQIGSVDTSGRMTSAIRFADSTGYSGLDIGATAGTIKIHGTAVEFTTTTAGVIFDGGLLKIMNGDSVPIFESGIYTGNTSRLGTIMINTTSHRTVIADSVIVSICDASNMADAMARLLTPVVWSRETGKFQVRFRRLDTNSWVTDAQRVSVSWLAIYN